MKSFDGNTHSLFPFSKLNSLCSMSVAVLYHVKNVTEPEHSPLFVLFDETLNPLTVCTLWISCSNHSLKKVMPDFTKLPDVVAVYRFISTIFRVQALPAEVAILALVRTLKFNISEISQNYTERLIAKSGVSLHQKNWRRVLLGAIVVASKVWEEDAGTPVIHVMKYLIIYS